MTHPTACSVCGAPVRAGTTTYVHQIDGRLTAVTSVPVETCPQCGEQYFSPETVDRLQHLLTHGADAKSPPKTIEVPAFPFS
jgi:YgiT-type zinc finger domain-containing protein